jgi:hypothetical protein
VGRGRTEAGRWAISAREAMANGDVAIGVRDFKHFRGVGDFGDGVVTHQSSVPRCNHARPFIIYAQPYLSKSGPMRAVMLAASSCH